MYPTCLDSTTTPCPVTKTDWEKDKSIFNCTNDFYHCIQDDKNRSGEICIQPVWVQINYCPEFNTGARTLDTVPCNLSTGCPNNQILSNEIYQYPVCLNKTHKEEISENGEYSVPSWFWIVVLTVVLGIVLVLSAARFVWIRKRKAHKEKKRVPPFEKSVPFHRTAGFHEATEFLENGGKFLVLSGIWGSGKTRTAKEVYRSVTGKSPTIITDLEKFDYEERNQALIFDEAISRDLSDVEIKRLQDKIKTWFEKVSVNETKTFIIFTSVENRKTPFAYITSAVSDDELKVINLVGSLTIGDQHQILNSHFTMFSPNNNLSKVEELATKGNHESLGYPEICALFCRCDEFQKMNALEFCEAPLKFLKSYLEKMFHSNENKFLMLVYMSLNQMEIDVKNPDEMLLNGLNTCKSDSQTQAEPLVDTIIKIIRHGNNDDIHSLMAWEFVDKVPKSSKYRLQHDVIKRMTLVVFGTFRFDKLLELSKRKDIEGWIIEKRKWTKEKMFFGDIFPELFIRADQWKQYVNKT